MDKRPKEITIIAVREQDDLLGFDTYSYPWISVLNLPIVKQRDRLEKNEFALMASYASTPGRYLEAAVVKIRDTIKTDVFLLNPLVEVTQELLLHLFLELTSPKECLTIFSTTCDISLGIYLPSSFLKHKQSIDELSSFRFLSCVSASLDYTLLLLKNSQTSFCIISCNANISNKSGFFIDQYLTNYKLITSHYIFAAQLKRNSNKVAYFPHHAGDLLFFLIALEETQNEFDTIIVNSRYRDIVIKKLPSIKIIEIKEPPLSFISSNDVIDHNIYQFDDLLYFYKCGYPLLPKNAPYYYFRASREHDDSEFHLIDQLKFSLTNEPFQLLCAHQETSVTNKIDNTEKSILLHFDGGWELKIYPEAYQKELVNLLKHDGFKITILSDRHSAFEKTERLVKFTNIHDFEKLVKRHAIVVGMDSFPGHFSTHVLKHPTIALFSSTGLNQANAPSSTRYEVICKGMKCAPCHSHDLCPIYKTTFCHNFATPKEVFDCVQKMYKRIYTKEV